jgi:hypothetical protein
VLCLVVRLCCLCAQSCHPRWLLCLLLPPPLLSLSLLSLSLHHQCSLRLLLLVVVGGPWTCAKSALQAPMCAAAGTGCRCGILALPAQQQQK